MTSMEKNQRQFLPQPYAQKRYYTLEDLKVHNQANDCWITFFNQVYDLTPLLQQSIDYPTNYQQLMKQSFVISIAPLTRPLIQAAGTDITYWFDPKTREPRKMVDINTGLEKYYCPKGQYLHISPPGPESNFDVSEVQTPWWKNSMYFIGRLTVRSVKIKIINMLTEHADIIEVPCEETINEILERYKEINKHAASYTWKRLGRPLDMDLNLEENNIIDQTEEFERLGVPEKDWYWPVIHLYFDDDLTVA